MQFTSSDFFYTYKPFQTHLLAKCCNMLRLINVKYPALWSDFHHQQCCYDHYHQQSRVRTERGANLKIYISIPHTVLLFNQVWKGLQWWCEFSWIIQEKDIFFWHRFYQPHTGHCKEHWSSIKKFNLFLLLCFLKLRILPYLDEAA